MSGTQLLFDEEVEAMTKALKEAEREAADIVADETIAAAIRAAREVTP